MESTACLLVVSEKDRHGAVSKHDWLHIVNKHPSLSPLPLRGDVPHSVSCVLRRSDRVSRRWSDKGPLRICPRAALALGSGSTKTKCETRGVIASVCHSAPSAIVVKLKFNKTGPVCRLRY